MGHQLDISRMSGMASLSLRKTRADALTTCVSISTICRTCAHLTRVSLCSDVTQVTFVDPIFPLDKRRTITASVSHIAGNRIRAGPMSRHQTANLTKQRMQDNVERTMKRQKTTQQTEKFVLQKLP